MQFKSPLTGQSNEEFAVNVLMSKPRIYLSVFSLNAILIDLD